MKKCPYSGAKVFEIFSSLQRRGLAMFLGFKNGEPMIWMDSKSPLSYAPISIATASVLLNEIRTRELEQALHPEIEVLVAEVLDALPAVRVVPRASVRPRVLRPAALIPEVV